MTTTSVPDFMADEDYSAPDLDGMMLQPGLSAAPETSAPGELHHDQPDAVAVGSDTSDAVGDSGSRDFNPILDSDQEEYEGELTATVAPVAAAEVVDSATTGAVSEADSDDFNPILNGDQEEYEGELAQRGAPVMVAEAPVAVDNREWKRRAAAGEVKGYEHPNKGKNPNSPTKKKRKPGTSYHRKHLSELDFTILGFLSLFEFLTTKQVGILRGISEPSARRLMLGLQEFGMVGQEKPDFGQQLWYLRGKGMSRVRGALPENLMASPLHRPGEYDLSKLRHTLAVAQVAAQFVAGVDNLRELIGVDLPTGVDALPFLVPERFIRSSHTSAMLTDGFKGGFKGEKAMVDHALSRRRQLKDRLEDGELDWDLAFYENPELWTVIPDRVNVHDGNGKSFHPPDLVLNLESFREDSDSVSIALEIELSPKTDAELLRIIRSYIHQTKPAGYAKVIYVCHDNKIAARVKKLAQAYSEERYQAHLPKSERQAQKLFSTAALPAADGRLFSGKSTDL